MHTLRPSTQRHAQRHAQVGAWLLVLAILLSAAWGQAHRVLHSGGLAPLAIAAKANADQQAAVAVLADEEGSSLCKLLDQLSLGSGLAAAPVLACGHVQPLALAQTPQTALLLAHASVFEARGPPHLA